MRVRNNKFQMKAGLLLGLSAFGLPQLSHATGTAAGSSIQNTAQVSYDLGGSTLTTSSNATTLTVAEIIDANIITLTSTVSVTPGATNQVLQYRLTNTGNGPEKFSLLPNSTLVGDDFDPALATNRIYFDADGTPGLSPGDTLYAPGSNDPSLNADAYIVVLVVNDIPTGLANGATGRSELSATSVTGGVSGTVGQIFTGQGVGGVDAVLGTTAGRANNSGAYVVGSIALTAVKSQVITNTLGNNQPVPGATITYQVVITPSGSGTANNVVFSDAIPANTTYVPNSITLNTGAGVVAMSDAADTDAGQFISTPTARVSVNLGALTAASAAQTVSFAVKIN
ncbi:MAG: hypothetical protein AB7Q04_01675 [Steroidobacteraceae bacterium]